MIEIGPYVYTDDNLLDKNINTIKLHAEILPEVS